MNKLLSRKNILKEAGVLLIVIVLSFSNLSAIANIKIDTPIKINQPNELSYAPSSTIQETFAILCYENFSSGEIPPINGEYGDWTNESVGEETWHNSTKEPKTEPYCAVVYRGFNKEQSDEWLITPSFDFSKITDSKIYLDFSFKGNYHTAHYLDNIDYNVKISINGGKDWTLVWNEDPLLNIYTNQWADIEKIDLTRFKGNSSVLIGFQFITFNDEERNGQYLYLDEIYVKNESNVKLFCDAGGPYEWDINRQYDQLPWGVRFQGEIDKPYYPSQCKWLWNFGDPYSILNSSLNYFTPYAIHFYRRTGTYNITLTVTHIKLDVFTKVNTTIVIFIGDPAYIKVTPQKFSIGIKAKIENLEDYNAADVNWTIEALWGPSYIFKRLVGNGTIEKLEPKIPYYIQSTSYFIKLGFIRIVITITPENMIPKTKTYSALKIGPFYFIFYGELISG